ncbi:glycosyltransferase [Bacillus sp. HSf4]|uniref:glycosyltransferase n=1 Tax=Bacillus sp. HSf4 TaxID=3035514 RepID=UPI00240A5D7B|nr:glycosyltransferase [Bacillus sp. HSf4]WFA07222.1 glycosyltransferase [Bacillus sp. HSf4]
MKILLAYYRYSPHTNGPSTYIDTLRKSLEEKGHTVDLMSHDKSWLNIQIADQQSADKHSMKRELIRRFQTSYTAKYPLWIYWREMERYSLEQAIKQFDMSGYDVIHCHDFMTARAMARSKPPHIPLIVSLHNFKYHEAKVTGEFYNKTEREQQYMKMEECLGAMSGDIVAVPCQWLKKQLIQIGVTPSKIQVIPYGIVKEPFIENENPAKKSRDEGKKTILCPARLVPVKGHRYLIEALSKLSRERKDFHCLLAGEGPELEALQRTAEQLDIGAAISFLGKRHDIPHLMNGSDIIVLPSLHDTFPLVILEGQFSAKPILAAEAGGIKEIIKDGADGLLVPTGNSDALAEKLRHLLDDDAFRSQLGRRAREKAMKYWDISVHMASMERLYLKCQVGQPASLEPSSGTEPDVEILKQIDPGITDQPGFILSGEIPTDLKSQLRERQHYIHVYDLSGVLLQTKAVEPEGVYEFHHLPAGSYVLKSTLESFGNQTISVGCR